MLDLSQPTLAIILGIKSILGGIVFYWLRISTKNISGLNLWAIGSFLVGIGALLDGLYAAERHLIVSLIFNTNIVFGQILFLFGTAQFVSRPLPRNFLFPTFLLIITVAATFIFVVPDDDVRIVVLTTVYASANFWMVWLLLRPQQLKIRFAYLISAITIFLQAAASIMHGIFAINGTEISPPFESWMIPSIIIIWINAISTIVLGHWILFLLITFRIIDAFKVMAEREERERIARELHDTVLQTFQAFVFRTGSMLAKSNLEQADILDRSLNDAITAIREGREKVAALRAHNDSALSLQENLRLICGQVAKEHQREFLFRCVGTERPIKAEVKSELCAIAQEALRNAFLHANATHHEVVIEFNSKALRMRILDNGNGISERDRVKPDHWGLAGIKERAQLINATLALHTDVDMGTTWEIEINAALAY